jgi:hypothetical protein
MRSWLIVLFVLLLATPALGNQDVRPVPTDQVAMAAGNVSCGFGLFRRKCCPQPKQLPAPPPEIKPPPEIAPPVEPEIVEPEPPAESEDTVNEFVVIICGIVAMIAFYAWQKSE